MQEVLAITLLVICCMLSSAVDSSSSSSSNLSSSSTAAFNVINFGAVGDGKTDDSQAFLKAWKAVCQEEVQFADNSTTTAILVIPARKTFMLKPVTFTGPCMPPKIFFQVSGNIVAPDKKTAWVGFHTNSWLSFSNINGLTVNGRGQIDGQGSIWWPQPCLDNVTNGVDCHAPTALTFNRCNALRLNGLTHINSPRSHITIATCNLVIISNLHIIAPETSPNTDGIDVSGSTGVVIRDSTIGTGDDCIAISGGSSNINITGVTCGPGHGISIGALGHGGFDAVEEIHVRNCTIKGTMNGVRVKTWQGGNGYARKISFKNIKLFEVNNPIIIDQFYCPSRVNCQNDTSAIRLSEITFSGIKGTSTAEEVINLSCSQSVGCTDIIVDRVYITAATPGKKTYVNCFNAHGRATHAIPVVNCLLPN